MPGMSARLDTAHPSVTHLLYPPSIARLHQPMMEIPPLYPTAIALASVLAAQGYRKGSLSLSGAIAAFLVGYGHLANPLQAFGYTLIFFYWVGSQATKVQIDTKSKLEEGVDPAKPSGNRNAIQVLSNCLPSLLAAVAYRFTATRPATGLLAENTCIVDDPYTRRLLYISLGQLACSLGDTLASEIGILWPGEPLYILTFQPVPPGTNGAVSILGLLASSFGGLGIGIVMVLSLLWEQPGCRGSIDGWAVNMLYFTAVHGGVGGSLLDTLLGATLQRTRYNTKTRKIITDSSTAAHDQKDVKTIGYGQNVLSNSAVNFISGAAIAAFGWWYAR